MSDINSEKSRKSIKVKDLAECAVFSVLMIVSAFIKIPFPFVPLTFQTVSTVLAGLLLGPVRGSISVAVYVFMGLLGLPVFAGGAGGFDYVLQLSFGYLLGFIAAAAVSGLVVGKRPRTMKRCIVAAMFGMLVNYVVGIPYFMLLWVYYYHNAGAWDALLINLIYIPKDVVFCFLAAVLAVRVYPVIRRESAMSVVAEENFDKADKKDDGLFDKDKNL